MLAIGIDGCRAGWIAVSIDDADQRDFQIVPRIDRLAIIDNAMVFIDMPIGLPESGDRGCDLQARKQLGFAWPRVFIGLRRPLLRFTDYAAANAWAKADGKGLAKQAFNILPKIAEIDAFLSPARQNNFRESHPELVFQRLNGRTALISKHKPAGLRARRDLLRAQGFKDIDDWSGKLRGSGAKVDDLYDAGVCALAARDATGSRARCIDSGATDARGLHMQIWY